MDAISQPIGWVGPNGFAGSPEYGDYLFFRHSDLDPVGLPDGNRPRRRTGIEPSDARAHGCENEESLEGELKGLRHESPNLSRAAA